MIAAFTCNRALASSQRGIERLIENETRCGCGQHPHGLPCVRTVEPAKRAKRQLFRSHRSRQGYAVRREVHAGERCLMGEGNCRQRASRSAKLGAACRAGAGRRIALELCLARLQFGGELAGILKHGTYRAAIEHVLLSVFPVDQSNENARAVKASRSEIRSSDGSAPMPLYDPVVALYLLQPDLFEFQAAPVDIELQGRYTRGMTVCDLRNRDARVANTQIAMQVRAEQALELLRQRLKAALT